MKKKTIQHRVCFKLLKINKNTKLIKTLKALKTKDMYNFIIIAKSMKELIFYVFLNKKQYLKFGDKKNVFSYF